MAGAPCTGARQQQAPGSSRRQAAPGAAGRAVQGRLRRSNLRRRRAAGSGAHEGPALGGSMHAGLKREGASPTASTLRLHASESAGPRTAPSHRSRSSISITPCHMGSREQTRQLQLQPRDRTAQPQERGRRRPSGSWQASSWRPLTGRRRRTARTRLMPRRSRERRTPRTPSGGPAGLPGAWASHGPERCCHRQMRRPSGGQATTTAPRRRFAPAATRQRACARG